MGGLVTKLSFAVALVTVAIVGAVTYLVANGNLTGSDATTIYVLILGGLGFTAGAHVTGNLVANAASSSTPSGSTGSAPTPAPVAAPGSPASQPAMPVQAA